jgi:hypothetical protein
LDPTCRAPRTVHVIGGPSPQMMSPGSGMAASASTQMRGPPPGWGGFGRGAPGFGGPLGPGGLKWVALATKFVSEMSKIILWENKAFN